MQLCTCILCKKNISCNDNIFNSIHYSEKTKFLGSLSSIHNTSCSQVSIFTMCKYRNANLCRLPHSLPCSSCIHNSSAIVTNCNSTCILKSLKISKIFTLLTCCHSSYCIQINVSNLFCLICYILQHLNIINYRFSIRHHAHCCVSASCCCS